MRQGSDSGETRDCTVGLAAFALWRAGSSPPVAIGGFCALVKHFPSFFTLFFPIQPTRAGGSEDTADAPTHLLVSWTNMADL